MSKQKTITLYPQNPTHGDGYTVSSTKNTMVYEVGEDITQEQAQELIDNRFIEVTIVQRPK